MTIRAVTRASLLYWGVGALMATTFYLVTGSSGFAPLIVRVSEGDGAWEVVRGLRAMPELLVNYAIRRAPLALLYGAIVTVMANRARAAWCSIAVGALVPLAFEVACAVPYARRWIRLIGGWVTPPHEWMQWDSWGRVQLSDGITWLLPGMIAGMLVAAWLAREARSTAVSERQTRP